LDPPLPSDADEADQVKYTGLEQIGVVRKLRPRGYEVGDLDSARDRFLALVGEIPAGWR
jgi:hypothetical protein